MDRPSSHHDRRRLCSRGWSATLALSIAFIALSFGPMPLSAALQTDPPRPWPRTCPDQNRFGYAPVRNPIGVYGAALAQLNAGWYQTFTILWNPPHPYGLGYVQTIRLSDDGPFQDRACLKCPTWAVLVAVAQANPGSLWLIGNEPDAQLQDNVTAGRYAELYHDFYRFLKTVDPTCQVAIGGVVQPTPLRLNYLDLILDAYQGKYGRTLPVDVFNAHNYILREEADVWGCQIPPGFPEDTHGMLYELEDHYNMDIWIEQMISLRTWMRDRGYGDLPLLISEYGILFYDGLGGCTPEITRDFMRDTFDWMMQTTNPQLGYAGDNYRLVQAWNWYSLDDRGQVNEAGDPVWLGLCHLFDSVTLQVTDLGLAYAGYTASIGAQPAVDLVVTAIGKALSQPDPSGHLSVTVTARVTNWGTETAGPVSVRFESASLPALEASIGSIASGELAEASVVWEGLAAGKFHSVTAIADPGGQEDPGGQIAECYEANNSRTSVLFTGNETIYFPLVHSGH